MRNLSNLLLVFALLLSTVAAEEAQHVFAGTVSRSGKNMLTVKGPDSDGGERTLRFRITDATKMPVTGSVSEGNRVAVRFFHENGQNKAVTIRLLRPRDKFPAANLPNLEDEK